MQRDGDHIPFVTSGSYPIRHGNRVIPLVDGEPAFRRICEAVERGIDVRVIFWRHPQFAELRPDAHFAGTEKDLAMLRARGSRFLARWDVISAETADELGKRDPIHDDSSYALVLDPLIDEVADSAAKGG